MECRKGDYVCLAGTYYCLSTGQECPYRDYNRIKEISIDGNTEAYNGCNLASLIEKEQRKTPPPFRTIR